MSFFKKTIAETVYQEEISECGLASISMVGDILGISLPLEELRERYPISMLGMTLDELTVILEENGITATPIKFSVENVNTLPVPAILHVGGNHFLCLSYITKNKCYLQDPAQGDKLTDVSLLERYVTGYAILCEKKIDAPVVNIHKKRSQSVEEKSNNKNFGIKFATPIRLLLMGLVAAIATIFGPTLISKILDSPINFNNNSSHLILLFIAYTATILVATFLNYRIGKGLLSLSRGLAHTYIVKAFSQLLKNEISFFEKRHAGDINARFSSYISALLGLIPMRVELVSSLVTLIGTLTLMLYFSPILTLMACLTIAFYGAVSSYFTRVREEATRVSEASKSAQGNFLYESIRGVTTIKSANLDIMKTKKYSSLLNSYLDNWKKDSLYGMQQGILYSLVASFEVLAMIGFALPMLLSGELTYGGFIAFSFFRQIALSAATSVYTIKVRKKIYSVSLQRAQSIFNAKRDNKINTLKTVEGDIFLKNVAHQYHQGKNAISDINFVIRQGKKIAIIGESGSGKTTLLKIISGLLQPTSGEIYVENFDKKGVEQLLGNVAIMQQGDILFDGSLKSNMTLEMEMSDSICNEILTKLGLIDQINSYPAKLATRVSEENPLLSVGQKQRILIARTLLQQQSIVILDEPTANLDTLSATRVLNYILESPKSVIVATHEADKLDDFDHIYRMQNGQLSLIK